MQVRTAALHEGFRPVTTDDLDNGFTATVVPVEGDDGTVLGTAFILEGTNGQRIVLAEPNFLNHLAVQAMLASDVVRS